MAERHGLKVSSGAPAVGPAGEKWLAFGVSVGMRMWEEQPGEEKPETAREYETVGYVVSGAAQLEVNGQTIDLRAGDSWLVPRGARHRYRILESLKAIEATSPPQHGDGR
jgi:mannose-6-phosphate isomerase-like protein (cupin superfamily)